MKIVSSVAQMAYTRKAIGRLVQGRRLVLGSEAMLDKAVGCCATSLGPICRSLRCKSH